MLAFMKNTDRNISFLESALFLCGLFIALIALFFSVVGLKQIFSATPIAIFLLGLGLEVGKLFLVVYSHLVPFSTAPIKKILMIAAIIVLMSITAVGIFGYLSKGYEQKLVDHNRNQIEYNEIVQKIEIAEAIADESESDPRIKKIEDEYSRIGELKNILSELNRAQISGDVEKIQRIINEPTFGVDGKYGAKTVARVKEFEDEIKQEIRDLEEKRDSEIRDLQSRRSGSEEDIVADKKRRDELKVKIDNYEKEFGPLHFVTKLFHGASDENPGDENPDKEDIEASITIMILVIMLVFDPLALGMIYLATYRTFSSGREQKKKEKWNWKWKRKRKETASGKMIMKGKQFPENPKVDDIFMNTDPKFGKALYKFNGEIWERI